MTDPSERTRVSMAHVLLDDIATKLTILAAIGVEVRLKHDSVITDCGYVLRSDDGYVARTLAYLPFPAEDTQGDT